MSATPLAWIGLGQMGQPMLRNLLAAAHRVTAFDLDQTVAQKFADVSGIAFAPSAQTAARHADIVVLMLPDSRVVDALLWDPAQGIAAAMRRGSLIIDMGSSDPVCSRDNHQQLKAMGVGFVDAPVSGGVKRAVSASLSIMIGGDTDDVARAWPILTSLGTSLVNVGSAGAGHAVKALNNYVSAAGLLAASESLVAAAKFGIDPHLVNQVFNASTGKNNTTEHKVEQFMLSEKFDSGFALALMRKDLQTALHFIDRMQSPQDFASRCVQSWSEAEAALGKGADHTEMFRYLTKHP